MKGEARPKNRGEGSETETESFLVGGRPESSEIFWQHFKMSLDQCFVVPSLNKEAIHLTLHLLCHCMYGYLIADNLVNC